MSDSSLRYEVEDSPSTSHSEDQNRSSKECAICSDDDDEFGNFEEASVSCDFEKGKNPSQSGSIDKCDYTENRRRSSQTANLTAKFPQLFELINDSNLWSYEEKENEDQREERLICDLFRKFDFCDNESTSGMHIAERDLRSLNLWSRLCYVEEAAALKFLWNNSVAYLNFLHSLKMNVNKILQLGDYSTLMRKANFPASTDSYSASSSGGVFMKRDVLNRINFNTSSELVDSLSVPPASFDWQTSGLSNPLTGSSMPAISAVLQCDFFNGDAPQSQCNGQSILQKELDALGLNENVLTDVVCRASIKQGDSVETSCVAESGFKNCITKTRLSTPKIDNNNQQNEENNHHNLSPVKLKDICGHSTDANHARERLPTDHNLIIGSRLASPIKDE